MERCTNTVTSYRSRAMILGGYHVTAQLGWHDEAVQTDRLGSIVAQLRLCTFLCLIGL